MVDEGMLSAFWCHKPWPSLLFINKLQIVEPGWNVSKSYKLASVDTTSALPMNCSMAASCFCSLSQLPTFSWWYWTEARFHLMQYTLHSSAPKQFWEIQWVGTSIPNHLAIKETSQTQFKSYYFFYCSGNNSTTNALLEHRNSWSLYWLNTIYQKLSKLQKGKHVSTTTFGLIPNKQTFKYQK